MNEEKREDSSKKDKFADREIAQRYHDRNDSEFRFHNQCTVEIGQTAVRSVFLINGGAAVAVLAFLSGLVGSEQLVDLQGVSKALWWFAFGVGLATLASCSAYFANFSNASRFGWRTQQYEYPYVEETVKNCARLTHRFDSSVSS
ncbi:MAG: hypothetical protein AAFR02_10285, partial [Pseudomonadota bacterium]